MLAHEQQITVLRGVVIGDKVDLQGSNHNEYAFIALFRISVHLGEIYVKSLVAKA